MSSPIGTSAMVYGIDSPLLDSIKKPTMRGEFQTKGRRNEYVKRE
jgi:hypothetical protein